MSSSKLPVPNFRDIGGHCVLNSKKHVKKGLIFRSSNIDTNQLQSHNYSIKAIFDLRHSAEQPGSSASSALPEKPTTDTLVFKAPALPSVDEALLAEYFGGLDLDPPAAFASLYTAIASRSGQAFGQIFGYLRDNPHSAILVHCEIGKDRTGVFCAILLLILGVSDEDIIDDYARSESEVQNLIEGRRERLFKHPFVKDVGVSSVAIERHFWAHPLSMRLFLARFRNAYGSGSGYLRCLGFSEVDAEIILRNLVEG